MNTSFFLQSIFFTVLVSSVVLFSSCGWGDNVEPKPPTADFTVSAGLLGRNLMTFNQETIFWESQDGSVAASYTLKLEAIDQHADTYEWYIHTDQTPTQTGPVYTSGFGLSGLGASEWPVTINTRLITSWRTNMDSVAKDTVDKKVTLYNFRENMITFQDTVHSNTKYEYPPYMGKYKGHLTSNPNEELTIDITTTSYGIWLQRINFPALMLVGLPKGCDDALAEFYFYTDRHFTIDGVMFFSPSESTWETCGLPVYHGEYNPETQQMRIRFGYDKIPRSEFINREEWHGREIDEFVGYKVE